MLAKIVQLSVPAKRAPHAAENEPIHILPPSLLFHNTDRKMFDSRWHSRQVRSDWVIFSTKQHKKRLHPEIELFRPDAAVGCASKTGLQKKQTDSSYGDASPHNSQISSPTPTQLLAHAKNPSYSPQTQTINQ